MEEQQIIENIKGGKYNPIIYFGPDLDMTSINSPITSTTVYKVHRPEDDSVYIPGGVSNDFSMLTAGFNGHGGRYIIVAKINFLLDHCVPGE